MLHLSRPIDFISEFDVASLYLEHGGKILLLHRQPHKSQGNKWGVPAGKADPHESIVDALVREVREETGVILSPLDVTGFREVYVIHPEHAFVYHMYHSLLLGPPKIVLNPAEHQTCKWATPEEALTMNLVDDLDTCIRLFYTL